MSMTDSTQEQSLEEEIRDVPTLMNKLKKAAIDREKLVVINRFIDEGGEELYYLAEQVGSNHSFAIDLCSRTQIPNIMSLLIFQNSRRQLLSNLMHTFDSAKEHREEHKERREGI